MITASVYETITVAEFMRVAAAVGMPTRVHHQGGREFIMLMVADRTTLVLIGQGGDILTFIDIWTNGKSNANRTNEFNHRNGSWCQVYVDEDSDPVLAMAVDVEGVTRDHLATRLLIWQLFVKNFAAFFGR
jgi:hypothetical protein